MSPCVKERTPPPFDVELAQAQVDRALHHQLLAWELFAHHVVEVLVGLNHQGNEALACSKGLLL